VSEPTRAADVADTSSKNRFARLQKWTAELDREQRKATRAEDLFRRAFYKWDRAAGSCRRLQKRIARLLAEVRQDAEAHRPAAADPQPRAAAYQ